MWTWVPMNYLITLPAAACWAALFVTGKRRTHRILKIAIEVATSGTNIVTAALYLHELDVLGDLVEQWESATVHATAQLIFAALCHAIRWWRGSRGTRQPRRVAAKRSRPAAPPAVPAGPQSVLAHTAVAPDTPRPAHGAQRSCRSRRR